LKEISKMLKGEVMWDPALVSMEGREYFRGDIRRQK
jgi:hypothetical protein